MGATSGTQDVLLLAVLAGAVGVVVLVVHLVRAVLPARPVLPAEDRPPAGLGRLVPMGAQVDRECRRGMVSLEMWLATDRRRAGAVGPQAGGFTVPQQRTERRAAEAG